MQDIKPRIKHSDFNLHKTMTTIKVINEKHEEYLVEINTGIYKNKEIFNEWLNKKGYIEVPREESKGQTALNLINLSKADNDISSLSKQFDEKIVFDKKSQSDKKVTKIAEESNDIKKSSFCLIF